MTDKKKSTNSAFSQQQITQISNACERVQNAININNSAIAKRLNEELEVEIKNYFNNDWKIDESLLPTFYNIARHFAQWQKEQMLKSAVNGFMDCDDSNEWIEITDRFVVTPATAGKKVKVIIIEDM